MKAAATTNPWDQELELGTASCGNSLFLIFNSFLFNLTLTAFFTSSHVYPLLQLHSALYCRVSPSNRRLRCTQFPPDPVSNP